MVWLEIGLRGSGSPERHTRRYRPYSRFWLEWIRGGVTKDCAKGKKKNNTMFVENGKKTISEKRRNFTHSEIISSSTLKKKTHHHPKKKINWPAR